MWFYKYIDEFSPEPWLSRLWKKLLVEHDYFCVLMPYNKDRTLRSLKWVIGMGKILNFMFVDTILAGLFFNDNGKCLTFATESACLTPLSLDQTDPLCQWTSNPDGTGYCHFSGPPNTFFATGICTLIITMVAVPLDKFLEKSCDEVKVLVQRLQVKVSGDIYTKEDAMNQEMGDELKDVQTLQNTVLRAARLTKMKKEMDDVSPEEELDIMLDSYNKLLEKAEGANTASKKMKMHELVSGNQLVDKEIHELMEVAKGGNRGPLLRKIEHARERAQYIGQQVSLIEGEDPREIFLLQQFLSNSLTGVSHFVANNVFFEHIETEEEAAGKMTKRICILILLPLYFSTLALYIFIFGVSIGSEATMFWLIGNIRSFAMDIFLLQPTKIWMQKIAVTNLAGNTVRKLQAVLRDRSVSIMRRSTGLMKYSNSLIQHLNPACRVARRYPELPSSRLLFSLSDYDLPLKKFDTKPSVLSVLSNLIGAIGATIMLVLVLLPEFIQESCIEVNVTFFVNALIIVLFYIGQIQYMIPIIIVGVFIAVSAWTHYRMSKKRQAEAEAECRELEDKLVILLRSKPQHGVKGVMSMLGNMKNGMFGSTKGNKVAPLSGKAVIVHGHAGTAVVPTTDVVVPFSPSASMADVTASAPIANSNANRAKLAPSMSVLNEANLVPLKRIGLAALPPEPHQLGVYNAAVITNEYINASTASNNAGISNSNWVVVSSPAAATTTSPKAQLTRGGSTLAPLRIYSPSMSIGSALDEEDKEDGTGAQMNLEINKIKPLPPIKVQNTNHQYLVPEVPTSSSLFQQEDEYS